MLPRQPFWNHDRLILASGTLLIAAFLTLVWQLFSASGAASHPSLLGWFISTSWTFGIVIVIALSGLCLGCACHTNTSNRDAVRWIFVAGVFLLFAAAATREAKREYAQKADIAIAAYEAERLSKAQEAAQAPVDGVDCAFLAEHIVAAPERDVGGLMNLYKAVRCDDAALAGAAMAGAAIARRRADSDATPSP